MFESIYFRFIFAFLGAYVISLLIPATGMYFIQVPNIKNSVNQIMVSKAQSLENLIEKYNISLNDAIKLIQSEDIVIEQFESSEKLPVTLTDNQMKQIENGNIITNIDTTQYRQMYAAFKVSNRWMYMHLNNRNNTMAHFFSLLIFLIVVPLILGSILLSFTTYTITKPIKKLSIASKRVAKGNLKEQIDAKGKGELRELIDNFNHMVKELSTNEYLHKEFVSNVSHEINTPITSLIGYAKLLKRKTLTDEKRNEYADILIYESERLSKLTSDLLRLSEVEKRGSIEKLEPFSLDEQLRDAVVLLQYSWENKNLDIDLDLDEIQYSGDQALMYQVWINLISNAIKYSENGGNIHISLKQNEKIIVTISDDGIGISEEDLQKVFLRFYKVDKARNSSGTGLGLSLVKKIVELHGGSIEVTSELNKGSTFTVKL